MPNTIDPARVPRLLKPELAAALELAEWEQVESSSVVRVAWARSGGVPLTTAGDDVTPGDEFPVGFMLVEFAHGGVYAYADVPRVVYEAIRDACSVGRAFNLLVKDRARWTRLR